MGRYRKKLAWDEIPVFLESGYYKCRKLESWVVVNFFDKQPLAPIPCGLHNNADGSHRRPKILNGKSGDTILIYIFGSVSEIVSGLLSENQDL